MHEHSFIKNIIDQVKDKERVYYIEIDVGELSGIEPDHLKEHLEEFTKWKVITKLVKAKVICSCSYIGKPRVLQKMHDLVLYNCPVCGNKVEVIEGKDIKIVKVVYK
jgi:Zn finger protein HypA/HybF involved in hydrogenase expression